MPKIPFSPGKLVNMVFYVKYFGTKEWGRGLAGIKCHILEDFTCKVGT